MRVCVSQCALCVWCIHVCMAHVIVIATWLLEAGDTPAMLQSRETIPFLVVNYVCPQSSVDTDTSHKDRIASSFPLVNNWISGVQKTSSLYSKEQVLVHAWKILFGSFYSPFLILWPSTWKPWVVFWARVAWSSVVNIIYTKCELLGLGSCILWVGLRDCCTCKARAFPGES